MGKREVNFFVLLVISFFSLENCFAFSRLSAHLLVKETISKYISKTYRRTTV
jgi:hypothetical protein